MLIKEALKVFGTKRRLAEVLGLAYQSVKGWGEEIPENRHQHVHLAINAYRNRPSSMSPKYIGWTKQERQREYAKLKQEWEDKNLADEKAYDAFVSQIVKELGL